MAEAASPSPERALELEQPQQPNTPATAAEDDRAERRSRSLDFWKNAIGAKITFRLFERYRYVYSFSFILFVFFFNRYILKYHFCFLGECIHTYISYLIPV